MSISNPVTPGLMSVVLGIVPVIAAWLYSEYLRYTKHSISAKAFVLLDESFLVENRLTLRAIHQIGEWKGWMACPTTVDASAGKIILVLNEAFSA
ncbi:hypothetical protein YC2023_006526 [Brassica napus]